MPKLRIPVPSGVEQALDSALDRALSIQRPVVTGYVDRIRRNKADATPAEVITRLETAYRRSVIGIGAAAGGTAALPGVGTATSIAAGGAEIAGFVSASAMYVLALAEVHGVPTSDPEVRRALVLATVLGEGSMAAIESGGVREGKHWAQIIARTAAKDQDKVKGINAKLGTLMLTRFGARQGALLAGRALPFGVGAGIGAFGNAALAKGAIKAARRAFGPAPEDWGPRVIDA